MITEKQLLKSLNELEDLVLKGGDPLMDADTEGAMSTQGKPMSKKIGKSKGENVAKAKPDMSMSDMSSADDDGSSEDADDEEEKKPPMSMGKAKKSEMPADDADGEETQKSLTDRVAEDTDMRKAIEVSDFLEGLVERTSETLDDIRKSLTMQLEKSQGAQQDFNQRLAKAVVGIGTTVNEMGSLLKSLINQPNVAQRKSVLSKSDIVDAPMAQGDAAISRRDAEDWLMSKAVTNHIPAIHVTEFEQSGGNFAVLPGSIRKAMENDLLK